MKSNLSNAELEARMAKIVKLANEARVNRDRSAQCDAFYEIALLADTTLAPSERRHRTEGTRENRSPETVVRR